MTQVLFLFDSVITLSHYYNLTSLGKVVLAKHIDSTTRPIESYDFVLFELPHQPDQYALTVFPNVRNCILVAFPGTRRFFPKYDKLWIQSLRDCGLVVYTEYDDDFSKFPDKETLINHLVRVRLDMRKENCCKIL